MSGKTLGQIAVEVLVDIVVDGLGKGLPALPVADQLQVVLGIFLFGKCRFEDGLFFLDTGEDGG